jgi:O-antigen/teichoic acid export membrane protein
MPNKRFSSVFLLYGTGLVVNRLLSLLLLPLLTNSLLPAEFGLWTLLQTLYLLLLTLAVHGLDEAVLRFTPQSPGEHPVFFSTAAAGALAASLLASLFALVPLSLTIPSGGPRAEYFLFFALWLASDSISLVCSAYFRALERPVPVAIFFAGQNVILILLLYVFVIHHPGGVAGVLKAHALSALLSILFWAPISFRAGTSRPSATGYRTLARFGLPLMFVSFIGLLTNYLDRYLVEFFLGREKTGVYSVGYRLGMVTFTLLCAFRMGWYPKFYALYQAKGRETAFAYARNLLPLLFLGIGTAALFISMFAPEIASVHVPGGTFIGREYWAGLPLVGFISLAYFFDAGATLLDAFLYYEQRLKLIIVAASAGLLSNILFNLILIKPLGLPGAALSTLLAYILLFLTIQIINHKKLGLNLISAKSLFLIIYFIAIATAGQLLIQTPVKAALMLAHCILVIYLLFSRSHVNSGQTAA